MTSTGKKFIPAAATRNCVGGGEIVEGIPLICASKIRLQNGNATEHGEKMLDLTYLSPRESLLLGLCFGEYATKRSADPEVTFISIIKDRLIPFIDTLGQSVTTYLGPNELPTDVTWKNCNGWKWGRANSRPDSVYSVFTDPLSRLSEERLETLFSGEALTDLEKEEIERDAPHAGPITAHTWRPGRKSLVELLIHSLSPYMCLSLQDHFSIGDTHEPSKVAGAYFEYWSSVAAQGHEVADAKTIGKEIPAAIRRTLDEQINKFGDGRLFKIGQLFGTLVAELDSFADRTLDEDFVRKDEFSKLWHAVYPAIRGEAAYRKATRKRRPQQYEPSKTGLLEYDIISNNQYASKSLDDLIMSSTDNTQLTYAAPRTVANRLQMDCWIAVGEILGILREIDGASELSDKFLARANIQVTDSPDMIEKCLRLAEWNLSQKTGKEGAPEFVIFATSNAIEAITKLVWPNEDFGKGGLAAFFTKKISERQGDLHERFAFIARLLHLSYRNRGEHEMSDFRCSYEEARFFVAGLRALLDISRQIMTNG